MSLEHRPELSSEARLGEEVAVPVVLEGRQEGQAATNRIKMERGICDVSNRVEQALLTKTRLILQYIVNHCNRVKTAQRASIAGHYNQVKH